METIEIPGILLISLIPIFLLLLFRFYYMLNIIEEYNMFLYYLKLELMKLKKLDIKMEHYFDNSVIKLTFWLFIDFRKWRLNQIVNDKILLFEVQKFIEKGKIE